MIEVLEASTKSGAAARVVMEQKFEAPSAGSDLSAEAAALLDFSISAKGVVALDGSAGELSMSLNSEDAVEVKMQYLNGTVWVTNPVTGEWEENAEMSDMMQSVSAASADQYLLPGQDMTFVGAGEVDGASAYEYRTETVVTPEYLEKLAGLGLLSEGSDMLVGETVTVSLWLSEDGLPLRSEVRTTMDKALEAMTGGQMDMLGGLTGVSLVQVTSWSEFGEVQAPSTPPVAAS